MKSEAYKAKYNQLIRENEEVANVVIAKILLVIAGVYILAGFLMAFGLFAGPVGITVALFAFGVVFALLSSLTLFIKTEKELHWLRYAYTMGLLLSVFFLNALVGYKIWLLYAVPVFLSVRYYNRRLTASVGAVAMLLSVCSAFTNAYFAPFIHIIDLNLVSFAEPGTLDYYSWLHNAVIKHGYDASQVIANGLRLSALPNCLCLLLVIFISESVISNGVRILMKESENCEQRIAMIRNSLVDGMTGLMNRRAFNEDIREITAEKAGNLTFLSFDVDGLREINATLGHDAGDEIIKGAAQCIRTSFELYGKIYRVGGDEFAAVIEANEEQAKRIKEVFLQTVGEWSGKQTKKLNLSMGYAHISEVEGKNKIEDVIKLADKRMYLEREIHLASAK